MSSKTTNERLLEEIARADKAEAALAEAQQARFSADYYSGKEDGYNEGNAVGYERGYQDAYKIGYRDGVRNSSFVAKQSKYGNPEADELLNENL